MELKHLRLIKTITEEGSLASSSEKLFLTQSALSHQLRELEERLKFKVFFRSRNQWELTEEGTELYKVANRVLAIMDQGLNNIKKIGEGSRGLVRISTECYSFYQGLPGFIQKMGALYPEIEVELNLMATHQPLSKLLAGEIDVAIVTARPMQETLTYLELFEDEIFAIMHREHSLGRKDFLEPEDFTQINLIIHSFPFETVSVHELFLRPHAITPAKISAVPLTEVALEMVNANMGIICMPKWALKSLKVSEDLVFKPVGPNGLKRSHFLVYRTEDKPKKYLNDFISNFQEEFTK